MKFNSTFGKQLKNLRHQRYLQNPIAFDFCKTQETFADKFLCNRTTVINWENDKTYPSVKLLLEICEELECTPNYLLCSSPIEQEDIPTISKKTGLTETSIVRIIKNSFLQKTLNFFLESNQSLKILDAIQEYSITSYISSEIFYSSYSEELRNKIKCAYSYLIATVSPLEKTMEHFIITLQREIPFANIKSTPKQPNKFISYLKSNLSEDRFNQLYLQKSLDCTEDELYQLFIKDIAVCTFEILENNNIKEYKLNKISQTICNLIDNFHYNSNYKGDI